MDRLNDHERRIGRRCWPLRFARKKWRDTIDAYRAVVLTTSLDILSI